MPHLVHVLGATDRDALHKHFAGLAHHDLRMRFGRSPDPAWLRLYVDGEIAVDNWQNQTWKNSGRHAARYLEKGFHVLRLEHCKCSGEGGFRVRWCGGGIAPNTVLAEPFLQREKVSRGPAE